MKIFNSIPAFSFLICMYSLSYSQSISGVINIYTEVTNVSATDITVASASGFIAGDRVLIIQMKGASVDETNTASFGDIVNYNSAGFYEFATIENISGLVITVQMPLCRSYEIPGRVQLIRVPVYDNVTVSGLVTATAWNGTTGGVVVMEITNMLTLNADINVDGSGFLGGGKCNGFFGCSDSNYKLSYVSSFSCGAGQKGEAIAELPTSENGARGKVANGGGGSNSGQHGGAGGGNFGAGGLSGYQWTSCPGYDDIQALGGAGLDYSDDRIFLGGGGGGGHQDNGLSVTDGSNGGGIIIINANTIDGMGNSISANGDDVTIITDSEGAGGGGAGGSVILRVNNFSSALNINVNGGDGGDILSTLWAGTCHGPGGAGGGGYVGFSVAAIPPTLTINNAGGDAGIITSPGAFCDGTTNGAEPGTVGGTILNLATFAYPVVNLGNDTSVCSGEPFILDAGLGYASYDWNTGDTTQTINITASGTYSVTVTNAFGCAASDTIIAELLASPNLTLPSIVQFCAGDSYILDAGGGFTSYEWQNGSTSQTITVNEPGLYWCTVSNNVGCTKTDTVNIPSLFPLPVVNLGNDTSICVGDAIILNAANDSSTYQWNNGSTDSVLNVTQPGIFTVTVTTNHGCSAFDNINVYDACDDLYFPNAFSPNGDGLNDVFQPVIIQPVGNYNLQIWNRWGQLVFSSSDDAIGWNGTFKNFDAEIDTYVWTVHYTKLLFSSSTQQITLNGTVTLVR